MKIVTSFAIFYNLIWSQWNMTFPFSPFQLQISCWMAVTFTHWTSKLPSKRQIFFPFTWLIFHDSNGPFFFLRKAQFRQNQLAEMYSLSFSDNCFSNEFSKKRLLSVSRSRNNSMDGCLKLQQFVFKISHQTCSMVCKNSALNFLTAEDVLSILNSEHVWHLQIRQFVGPSLKQILT